MVPDLKAIYTLPECAELLGCSVYQLEKLIAQYAIEPTMMGSREVLQLADLVAGDSKLCVTIRAVLKSKGYSIPEPSQAEDTAE